MALTPQQLKLQVKYEHLLAEQVKDYKAAPDELRKTLKTVWHALEETVAIKDNPTAKLSAVSALIHLRELATELEPKDMKTLVDLLIGLALSKE